MVRNLFNRRGGKRWDSIPASLPTRTKYNTPLARPDWPEGRPDAGLHGALAPLDLHVETGRTTVLIGPSGCGKSTLLRLMTGLLWPDSGLIHFRGKLLTPENILQSRRSMGYVIQEGGLFAHLTAGRNV